MILLQVFVASLVIRETPRLALLVLQSLNIQQSNVGVVL